MTRKGYLPKTAPTLALATVVISVKRLLITEKSSATTVDGSSSSLENLSQRATQMTKTLRMFEGYSHHGIND
jgi:hypothetical protein